MLPFIAFFCRHFLLAPLFFVSLQIVCCRRFLEQDKEIRDWLIVIYDHMNR